MSTARSLRVPQPRRQRGATLLVGLIMLLLLTLHAIAAFHTSTTQLRIVGNMQDRHAAEAAANQVIASALVAGAFAADPAAVAASPGQVDIDGDGTDDFVVALAPACRSVQPLPPAAIDADSETDFACVSGAAFGPASLCALTQWDVQATATIAGPGAQTGAAIEVHQGAAVRMTTTEANASC
jgi:type IV pilus assembly PilX-like protein